MIIDWVQEVPRCLDSHPISVVTVPIADRSCEEPEEADWKSEIATELDELPIIIPLKILQSFN